MPTFFFAGIYGVGKNTLCTTLSERTGFPFFSASDLISEINGEKYGANKAVSDKEMNQNILIECVSSILSENESIILAGHFCIIGKTGGVGNLPEHVFEKLQIKKIVILESETQRIISHLAGRDRKKYTPDLINALCQSEHQAAQRTAERINCPLLVHHMHYSSQDIDDILPWL